VRSFSLPEIDLGCSEVNLVLDIELVGLCSIFIRFYLIENACPEPANDIYSPDTSIFLELPRVNVLLIGVNGGRTDDDLLCDQHSRLESGLFGLCSIFMVYDLL